MQKQSTKAPVAAPHSPGRVSSFDPEVALAFGQVVRSIRERAQIAQDAFAFAAGIDRSYYGKLERGERQPSLSLILRVAEGLGVSAAEIISTVEVRRAAMKKAARRAKLDSP